jgi:hypothetical protein
MRTSVYARRLLIALCLAAVLFAALSPVASALHVAVLVPLWFFFAAVLSVPLRRVTERVNVRRFPFLPVLTPRPPPVG